MTGIAINTVLTVGSAATLIVASGVGDRFPVAWVTGQDWQKPAERKSIVIPASVGDWEREQGPTAIAGLPGGVEWGLRRQRPERVARVCVVVGDGRTLAAFGPQSCYPQTSLRIDSEIAEQTVQAANREIKFSAAGFWKEEAGARRNLRALWSCRTHAGWTAAGSVPAGTPALAIYLFIEEPLPGITDGERLVDLAQTLLPLLEHALDASDSPAADDPSHVTN